MAAQREKLLTEMENSLHIRQEQAAQCSEQVQITTSYSTHRLATGHTCNILHTRHFYNSILSAH